MNKVSIELQSVVWIKTINLTSFCVCVYVKGGHIAVRVTDTFDTSKEI